MRDRKGIGGRPRKPRGLHLVDGTHRLDRHGSRDSAQTAARAAGSGPVPAPPAHLGPIARQEWRRVAKQIHARGDFESIDRGAFAGYCQAWEAFVQAEAGVRSTLAAAATALRLEPLNAEAARVVAYSGRVVPGKDGTWVRNPADLILNAAAKRLLDFGREFGMTPVARARKVATGAGPEAPAGDFPEDMRDDAAGA